MLIDLALKHPEGLILEGEATVQWHLEGDYRWGIVNGTENIIIREEEYQGSPIIHISPVDCIIEITNSKRMEALTFAVFALSILASYPIIKSIAFQNVASGNSKKKRTPKVPKVAFE